MTQDAQQTADQQAAQIMEDDPQIVKMAGDFYVAKFFIYLANFAFPGAGGTLSQSITIDSDADFEMLYLTGNATGADNTDQSNFITVLIREGSAGGITWMTDPVNMNNLLGTGQLPFPIGLIPQLLPKKRVYVITLVSTSAEAVNAQMCFVGYKLYPASQSMAVGAAPSQS